MNRVTILWSLTVVISILIIIYVTLSPGIVNKGINLIPFKENVVFVKAFFGYGKLSRQERLRGYLNLFGNIVLFMPFGCSLAGLLSSTSMRSSARVVVLSGGLLSLGIELLQLFIPTRATDIDDVMFNTISTSLGVLVFSIMNHLYQRIRGVACGKMI